MDYGIALEVLQANDALTRVGHVEPTLELLGNLLSSIFSRAVLAARIHLPQALGVIPRSYENSVYSARITRLRAPLVRRHARPPQTRDPQI